MKYLVNRETKEHRIHCQNHPAGTLICKVWEVVDADDDGWIKHDGGECPLPESQRGEIKLSWFDGEVAFEVAPHIGWEDKTLTHYRPILGAKPDYTARKLSEAESQSWRDRAGIGTRPRDNIPPVSQNELSSWFTDTEKLDDTPYPVGDPRGWQEVGYSDLIDRLIASHKAASELPDIIAELRDTLGPELMEMLCSKGNPEVSSFTFQPLGGEFERAIMENLSDLYEPEPEPDMTDWRNWREGDLVECVSQRSVFYPVGFVAEIGYDEDGGYGVKDKGGDVLNRGNFSHDGFEPGIFRFHSRPTKEPKA